MAATTKTLSVDLAPLVDGADFATLRVWVTVDQPRLTDLTTGATRVGPFEAIKDEDTVTSAEVELPDNSWDPSPHWYRLHVQYRTLSFGDLQKWVSGSFQMDTDKTLADLPLEMPQAVDAVEYASFFELIEQADQARVDAVAAQQAAEEARDSAVEVATGDLVPALGALGLPQSGSDLSASIGAIKAWAKNPDNLVVGSLTYAGDLLATAAVVWPDGATGTLTITSRQSGTDAVTGYTITRVVSGQPTKTYTQPTITRDSSGRATAVPQITVA